MSDTERFVSPYLLRPCRSLQEVLREQEEQHASANSSEAQLRRRANLGRNDQTEEE
jgi:hypothetical protein